MQIPIENLYYLLCYAWNQLETQDQVKVQLNGTTELVDLFAKVLLESSQLLLKRGLEKSYLSQNAAVPGVKGKLEISETLKQQLHFKLQTHCQFDDFSANVLSNRILVSTLMRLVRTEALHPQLKKGLLAVLPRFVGVEPIAVSPSLFQQVCSGPRN